MTSTTCFWRCFIITHHATQQLLAGASVSSGWLVSAGGRMMVVQVARELRPPAASDSGVEVYSRMTCDGEGGHSSIQHDLAAARASSRKCEAAQLLAELSGAPSARLLPGSMSAPC